MIILGLSLTLDLEGMNKQPVHLLRDTGAGLVVDGDVVSAVDTKKLSSRKPQRTPLPALRFVLGDYSLKFTKIDKIALWGTEDDLNREFKNGYLTRGRKDFIDTRRSISGLFLEVFHTDFRDDRLFFVDPHLAYAANALRMSGSPNCLFLTLHKTHDLHHGIGKLIKLQDENGPVLDSFPDPFSPPGNPAKDLLDSLYRYGRGLGSPELCITGNLEPPACFEEKISAAGIFANIFRQPAGQSAGNALGAALYLHYQEMARQPRLEKKHETYRNETEQRLGEAWQEILAMDKPGINDDFFALGGNSLKAIVLENEIHKKFNVKLSLAEIFKYPTIKELSQCIAGLAKDRHKPLEPVEKKSYYVSSSAQQRLYVIQQMELSSIAYNVPQRFSLSGNLDLERLQQSFHRLVRRHESLRTSFHMAGDTLIQRVHDEVELEIEYADQTLTGELNRGDRFKKPLIRPFDLSAAPLVRIGLEKQGQTEYKLLVDMHHIIADGISTNLFFNEFMTSYLGNPLTPLRLQYKDFSEWQNSREMKAWMKAQQDYWLKEFSVEIPVLNLPVDFPPPQIPRFAGKTRGFDISTEQTAALNRLALEQGTTLYMVLLAIYNILLSKLSSQKDIVVGTPAAGRRHSDLEKIMGMFVNTLALRNYPVGEKRFIRFLGEVKNRTLEAFSNQDYQYDELVAALGAERENRRDPLFATMFALQNLDTPEFNLPGLKLSPDLYDPGISKFDLSLQCAEREDTLWCDFEYSTTLFAEATIERFIGYFKTVIAVVNRNPEVKIAGIEILSEPERRQVLKDFNKAEVTYPADKTIVELFENRVKTNPHAISLIHGQQGLTYGVLNQQVYPLAYVLKEKGVGADCIVGVMVERSFEMIVAILAILKAGGAYLPLDLDYPGERIRYLLKDSRAEFLLTGKSGANTVNFDKQLIELDFLPTLASLRLPAGYRFNSLHPGNLAYVIYTSGTTGKPKGVMVEHRNVTTYLYAFYKDFHVGATDTMIQLASYTFDVFVEEVFGILLRGGKIIIVSAFARMDIDFLSRLLVKHHVTILDCTPLQLYEFNHFLTNEGNPGENPLEKVRAINSGGDVLKAQYVDNLLGMGNVYNHYGPTETTVSATYYRCRPFHEKNRDTAASRIPIGKPIFNYKVYILDESIKPVPIGVAGELTIAGEGVARGYLNRPARTHEKFIPNPFATNGKMYCTGDLAKWRRCGNIEFLGRIDHQVKIRGYRIELGEIENRLMKHKEIKGTVALATADADKTGEMHLCAYFVSAKELTGSELREFLAKELPAHMIPSFFIRLDNIPLTPNGKIDRRALPPPAPRAEEVYSVPLGEAETQLAELWSQVLGIEKNMIGRDSNFFYLGGHSIKATALVSKIHRTLQTKIPLSLIFTDPTLKEMAQTIYQTRENSCASPEAAEKKEHYPLSAAQKRLYVLQQLEFNSTAYNVPQVVTLEGTVAAGRLEQTFKKLVARHESYRTSFEMTWDEPVQKVHESLDFKIACFDAVDGSSAVQRIIRDFVKPFDLSRLPLLRVGLIKLSAGKHILIMDLHHIITDGFSQDLMARELIPLYDERNLPALKLQYKDYSEWQNHGKQQEALKKQEGYWLAVYRDAIPRLTLVHDFTRPQVRDSQGSALDFIFSGDRVKQLKNLASGKDVTLFMVLLALYYVLLAKLSGQEDIVVGTPVSGRNHGDLEPIVGMFVNTLALRNYPSPEKTFNQFLEEIKKRTLEAFDNQDYPFEELVDKLKIERNSERNPLFDVMFTFETQNRDIEGILEETTLNVKSSNYENRTAKFDMVLNALETQQDLRFKIEFSTVLLKTGTIERFAAYYKDIVSAVLPDGDIRLKDIEISLKLTDSKSAISHEARGDFGF